MGLDNERIYDIVLISVSAALFVIYHIYFWFVALNKPTVATLRINMELRRRWVEKCHNKPGMELLGVQTLRNLVTGATFMATVSVTVGTAFAGYALIYISGMRQVKATALAGVFFVAFILFTWSIRSATHASILIGLRPADLEEQQGSMNFDGSADVSHHLPILRDTTAQEEEQDKQQEDNEEEGEEEGQRDEEEGESMNMTRRKLRRMRRKEKTRAKKQILYSRVTPLTERFLDHYTIYFHLGIRCFYLTIPLLAWFLSPWAMLGVAIATVITMYFHDHETALPSPLYLVRAFY